MQFNLVKFNYIITCLLFACSALSYSQQTNDTLKILNQRFQAFDYEKTISTADSLLNINDSMSKDLRLEIYRIKGISHFSLLQDEMARDSFLGILRVDSAYILDTTKTSPKIISFFNQVKNIYRVGVQQAQVFPEQRDTVYITKIIDNPEISLNVKNAIIRSLVLPGWGHLYSGHSTKGIILSSLGALSILSSVYFIISTNNKEDEYMNAKVFSQVTLKYDEYNRAYKLKNYSLIALAAVWLYSQIDLLIFSNESETVQGNSDLDVKMLSESFTLQVRLNF